jgi:hypothetical protein
MASQNFPALGVNNLTLLVHDIVIFDQVFTISKLCASTFFCAFSMNW